MTTAVDGKTFSNIAATTAQFTLKGGYYMVSSVFTGAGSVELQALGPDGLTWMSLPTPLKITTSGGMIAGYAAPGQYRFTIVTVTAAFCSVGGVPIS
jgi:hypothetical protein